ncbi:low temperature requirement protein A [Microbacterium sp. P01]|uniref:low temperature requirement protein A n=1 Tax=unclassified Microbacterium TaxID=2609290 RepID=UPI00366F448B
MAGHEVDGHPGAAERMGYYRHALTRMRGRSTAGSHRPATPLELLFDLTFVAAFGVAGNEFAHAIAEGHWQSGLVAFMFAMGSIVWAWINFSWFASAFDTDDWLFRVVTMVQMTGVIVLAIGIPALFASIEEGQAIDNRVVVAGYVVMRVAMVAQWLRVAASDPVYRSAALTYAVFVSVAQVGWIAVAILPFDLLQASFAAILLWSIELLGPVVAERRGVRSGGGSTPWHPLHIAERYSLLTIVALGETVLGTLAAAQGISAAEGWGVSTVVIIGAGVALSFALWWLYFLVPAGPVLALRRDRAFPWGYGHILVFASIAAVGTGLHVIGYVYDEHYHVSTMTAVVAIAVPVLIFLVAILLLHAWLLSSLPRTAGLQFITLLLPAAAIGAAALGVDLWACVLLVLAAPVVLILAYEGGAWRMLQTQLDSVLGDHR